jgi:hypothetical protein
MRSLGPGPPPVLSGSEGLAMLLLPKRVKLCQVRLSLPAVRRPQFLSAMSFDFFIDGAALKLIQTKIIISIYMAESADNLPDHHLGF